MPTSLMQIRTSHGDGPIPATREAIRETVADLPGRARPFAILGGADDQTYIQTLATSSGFVLEYQEGSTDRHFGSVRSDLSADEVVAALGAYLEGNPAWQGSIEFHPVDLAAESNGIAGWLTKFLSRLLG